MSNKKIDRFGGIEKLIEVITYLHHHPYSSTKNIINNCKISVAGFYRHRKYAKIFLNLTIIFIKQSSGHIITDYGIINRDKL